MLLLLQKGNWLAAFFEYFKKYFSKLQAPFPPKGQLG